jgi:DNA-binding PadR family transcriptional regulator
MKRTQLSNTRNFDVQGLIESVRDAVSTRISGLTNQMTKPSKADLRLAVLSALEGASRNGKEVIQSIQLASGGTWVPASSEIYPLLEELTDEGLVTIKIDGERRVYKLSKAGAKYLAETIQNAKPNTPNQKSAAKSKGSPINMELLKSSSLLAQAVTQVAQTCSTEKQAEVVAIIDEARRKTHSILAQD